MQVIECVERAVLRQRAVTRAREGGRVDFALADVQRANQDRAQELDASRALLAVLDEFGALAKKLCSFRVEDKCIKQFPRKNQEKGEYVYSIEKKRE